MVTTNSHTRNRTNDKINEDKNKVTTEKPTVFETVCFNCVWVKLKETPPHFIYNKIQIYKIQINLNDHLFSLVSKIKFK